jgi:hypothetical protein
VQSGTAQIFNNTNLTYTITISPINPAKSLATIRSTNNGNADFSAVKIEIQNATTLLVTRTTGTSDTSIYIVWTVTEFNNVKSKQTGTYALTTAGAEQSVAISSINVTKYILAYSCTSITASSAAAYFWANGRVINSTTLGFFSLTGITGLTIEWQVIEFN